MKRWISLLLVLSALLGLLGQEAAFAGVMPVKQTQQAEAADQMSPECAEMMGLAKQKPQSDEPCQGMTPDCIAKMGCAVPLALLPPPAPDALPQIRTALLGLVAQAPMIGRSFGPEPKPPAHLG